MDFNEDSMYILVMWPEVQELMDEDWFFDEAVLSIHPNHDSSYFIPIKRLK